MKKLSSGKVINYFDFNEKIQVKKIMQMLLAVLTSLEIHLKSGFKL